MHVLPTALSLRIKYDTPSPLRVLAITDFMGTFSVLALRVLAPYRQKRKCILCLYHYNVCVFC